MKFVLYISVWRDARHVGDRFLQVKKPEQQLKVYRLLYDV